MLGQPLRDRAAVSSDAVAQVLVRISQLIVDFPDNRGAGRAVAVRGRPRACWPPMPGCVCARRMSGRAAGDRALIRWS